MADQVILMSYVPLVDGSPGQTLENGEGGVAVIQELMDGAPTGQADGCAWSENGPEVMPVLMFCGAEEILAHLVRWSEGKPEKWFDLYLRGKGDQYAIALCPKIAMSVERYKMAFQLRTGYPPPKGQEFTAVFRPLFFISGKEPRTYRFLKDRLGKTTEVAIADTEKGLPRPGDPWAPARLGRFKVVTDGPMTGLVDSLFDEG